MEQLERWILISLQRWKMHLKLLFAAIHSQMFRAFQNIKILSSSSQFLVRQRNHSNSHQEGLVILILLLGHRPVEEEEWAMLKRQCWKKIYLDARMDARPAGKWVSCPTPPRDPWNTLAAPPCPAPPRKTEGQRQGNAISFGPPSADFGFIWSDLSFP